MTTKVHPLNLICSNDSQATYDVSFSIVEGKDALSIQFDTISSQDSWNMNEQFSTDPRKNWGLWNTDVVEVFWQNRQSPTDLQATYQEWQIAPNDKYFCLEISKPRISFHTPLVCPIRFTSKLLSPNHWQASFIIPKIQQHIQHLYLGLFAILGSENDRQYYAYKGIPTTRPNFHLPEFFLPLSELK